LKLTQRAYGIPYASVEDLSGGSADDNAQITMEIMAGKKGPKRDIILLNAAAALWLAEKVEGIPQGIKLAASCIDSGKTRKKLQALIDFSRLA